MSRRARLRHLVRVGAICLLLLLLVIDSTFVRASAAVAVFVGAILLLGRLREDRQAQ
jgi:hypothetical protein